MHELTGPFRRMIEHACPPATVRAIEAGGDWRPLWRTIVESGFLDALVPEGAGGAGLSLAEVAPLIAIVGAHCVPLPIGETMIARALLARADATVPTGPLVLATGAVPTLLAGVAESALSGTLEVPRLISLSAIAARSDGDLHAVVPGADERLRPIAAILRALLIAGAAERVLSMTIAYANDRSQFGKPIARQQAIQQQLAVLAEQAMAARFAAQIGARGGIIAETQIAAIAKCGASRFVPSMIAIAHAVHGAIGISAEYDLQLLTRRLSEWRLADGSESFWAERIGAIRSASPPI